MKIRRKIHENRAGAEAKTRFFKNRFFFDEWVFQWIWDGFFHVFWKFFWQFWHRRGLQNRVEISYWFWAWFGLAWSSSWDAFGSNLGTLWSSWRGLGAQIGRQEGSKIRQKSDLGAKVAPRRFRDAILEDFGALGTRLGMLFVEILMRFHGFFLVFWWLVARMCANSVWDASSCMHAFETLFYICALPVHMSRKVFFPLFFALGGAVRRSRSEENASSFTYRFLMWFSREFGGKRVPKLS